MRATRRGKPSFFPASTVLLVEKCLKVHILLRGWDSELPPLSTQT